YFFFQAEDGIRDGHVTGVQTCALPIFMNEWMRQNGFVERFPRQLVHDVVVSREREMPELITVSSHEKVGKAIDLLQEYGISQMRSEERRVGKECRSGWWLNEYNEKTTM